MNHLIFDRIRTGDRRQKRAWSHALYCSLKGFLTEEGYRNPVFEKAFVLQSPEDQVNYLDQSVETIASIPGYSNHAQNLSSLAEHYYSFNDRTVYPKCHVKKFSGRIKKWNEHEIDDGTSEGRTINIGFLTSDINPGDCMGGFYLPKGMKKLPVGTPVEIVALGDFRPDGLFYSNDLCGVKIANDLAEKEGIFEGVYFDVLRDYAEVLKFSIASQKKLEEARHLLYSE